MKNYHKWKQITWLLWSQMCYDVRLWKDNFSSLFIHEHLFSTWASLSPKVQQNYLSMPSNSQLF